MKLIIVLIFIALMVWFVRLAKKATKENGNRRIDLKYKAKLSRGQGEARERVAKAKYYKYHDGSTSIRVRLRLQEPCSVYVNEQFIGKTEDVKGQQILELRSWAGSVVPSVSLGDEVIIQLDGEEIARAAFRLDD